MNAANSRAWPAPAKLNLFIHVTGRRPDGYHTLQTVYQFLDYADTLGFTLRADGLITRSKGPAGLPAAEDLAVRAARLLQQATAYREGVDIRVRKRIPAGAGLGGGSSDAATVLVALNRLWELNLPPEELAALGLQLGADVPVFVNGQAAWAEGVGEQLQPIAELPEPWYLVVQPPAAVSTREIYQAPELTRNSAPITISGFLAGEGRNDFLPVVSARHPEVAAALDWLGRFGAARLTGTGCSVFAAFAAEPTAYAVLAKLPKGWRGFVARGLNESPLLGRLRQPN